MTRVRAVLILLLSAAAITLTAVAWFIATRLAGPTPTPRSAIGQERPIGGFDPHLVVALIDIERLDEATGIDLPPEGVYVLLNLRARSNAAEIMVDPSDLDIYVEGRDGIIYSPLERGPYRARFEPGEIPPGGVRLQVFLFDLPLDGSELELWVTEPTWLTAFLPGGRESRLFRKLVVPLG